MGTWQKSSLNESYILEEKNEKWPIFVSVTLIKMAIALFALNRLSWNGPQMKAICCGFNLRP